MIPGTSGIARMPRVGSAGAAGNSRLWTPLDIAPALAGWLDADPDTWTLVDGKVSEWRSKVGTFTATQATAGNRPTPTTLNGLPTLDWLRGSTVMALPTASMPSGASSFTVLLAASNAYTANAASNRIISWGNTNSGQTPLLGMGLSSTNGPQVGSGSTELTAAQTAWTDARTFAWQHLRTGTAPTHLCRLHGRAMASGVGTSVTAANVNRTELGVSWLGSISAFALASRSLPEPDIERWEGYYAHRLGTAASLPTDHPYRSEPPRI